MATGNERSAPSAERVVHASPFGVVCFTPTGSVVFANRRMEGILGYGPGEMAGKTADDIETDGTEGEGEGAVGVEEIVHGYAGSSSHPPETPANTELLDGDGDPVPVAVVAETVETEEGRYVTLWVYERTGLSVGENGQTGKKDEVNRKESGRVDTSGSAKEERHAAPEGNRQDTALGILTEAGCELSGARNKKEVAEACLGAAGRLLGSDVVCVRYFDEETNSLETVATTERAKKMMESRRAFDLGRTGAGRALRHGEPVVDRQGTRDSAASLHVPLGERGTLTAFRTATEDPIETEIDLARRLGSLAEASLERLESGEISETDPDSYDPESLRRIHEPVREAVKGVAEDRTHEELGHRVCDVLAGSDRYRGAWFLGVDAGGKTRVEASSGGVGPSGVPDAVKENEDGKSAVRRAIETGEVSSVSRQQGVGTAATSGAQKQEATGFVVPISYGDRTYSALVVSTATEDGVETGADTASRPLAHAELRILKDVLGLGVYATKNRELLLSEKVLRLEFEVTDPGCLAVAVSEETGCYCEIEHSTLTNEGNPLVYMKVEGAPPDEVCEATESADSVVECRPIETSDEGGVVEVVKSRSGAEALTDVGATVTKATAEDGVGRLVVEAPPSADVHEIVEAYRDLNPDSRLVAKREVDRPATTKRAFGEGIDEALTERQSSVLKTAYYAGYYDWPRGSTAEDIAESLGISPATFHQHIRKAERETVGLVCDIGD